MTYGNVEYLMVCLFVCMFVPQTEDLHLLHKQVREDMRLVPSTIFTVCCVCGVITGDGLIHGLINSK